MASVSQVGHAGLQGWREKVADGVAGPVAQRTPLKEDNVRAIIGATFLVLSVVYLVNAIRALTQG
jgi:hypothetical protein